MHVIPSECPTIVTLLVAYLDIVVWTADRMPVAVLYTNKYMPLEVERTRTWSARQRILSAPQYPMTAPGRGSSPVSS